MQSYELHIDSDVLKERHPYLDLPFKQRYDSSRVYLAVFDRAIAKLVSILEMEGLESYKYRDCLITLNEMVSHQEVKANMIDTGLVAITSAFLSSSEVAIRRESVLLLGSMFSLKKARDLALPQTYSGLTNMLFEEVPLAREACMWTINRFVSGRDGVCKLADNQVVPRIIESFLKYSSSLCPEDCPFLKYLLEALTKILQYDNGIVFFFKCDMVARMNSLLARSDPLLKGMNHLMLDCLSKITETEEGKQEAIDHQVLQNAASYLDSSCPQEVYYSVFLVSNITLHLDGKKTAIEYDDQVIIKRCIANLECDSPDIVFNIKQVLMNVSDLPQGFQAITLLLLDKVAFLDDIFNVRSVVSLAQLLPLTSQLPNPPCLPQESLAQLIKYVKVLCYFLLKYDQAIKLTITDTQKIEEKLVVFLLVPDQALQDQIANTLYKICYVNVMSRHILAKYISKYGSSPQTGPKLQEQIQKYPRLYDLLELDENYDL